VVFPDRRSERRPRVGPWAWRVARPSGLGVDGRDGARPP
jgi:hypothetical protein